jgi:hypothetical protein
MRLYKTYKALWDGLVVKILPSPQVITHQISITFAVFGLQPNPLQHILYLKLNQSFHFSEKYMAHHTDDAHFMKGQNNKNNSLHSINCTDELFANNNNKSCRMEDSKLQILIAFSCHTALLYFLSFPTASIVQILEAGMTYLTTTSQIQWLYNM